MKIDEAKEAAFSDMKKEDSPGQKFKVCSICKSMKRISAFRYSLKNNRKRHLSYCNTCNRDYQRKLTKCSPAKSDNFNHPLL